MSSETISIKAAFRVGWDGMKAHFLLWVGVLALLVIVPMLPLPLALLDVWLLSFLMEVGTWLLQILMVFGMLRVALTIVDGGTPKISQLFSEYRPLINFIAAYILYGIIVMIGFFLLVIPGIIWAIKYQFIDFIVLDEGKGPLAALQRSGEITAGNKWQLFWYGILAALVTYLGILAFGVGVLVSHPVVMVSRAHIYRQLNPASQKGQADQPTSPAKSPDDGREASSVKLAETDNGAAPSATS